MHQIIIQYTTEKVHSPKKNLIKKWAENALNKNMESAEITVRIVDIEEMTHLNTTYRKKMGPTNVLSFPFSIPDEVDIEIPILGDIVICAEIVNREALEQNKSKEAHWAHMIVHGVFHLLGYDHENDKDAMLMENLEIEVMQKLGFTNPYETGEDIKYYD